MHIAELSTAPGRERFDSRARVTCSPASSAEQWTRQFRCSARDLANAVNAVGSDPLDVGVYLERRC